VIGSLVALHLLGVQQLLSRPPRIGTGIVATAVERGGALAHFLAGGSFSLYLVHYPAMQLVASALPGAPGSVRRQLTLLACVLFCCFGFAALFERRLPELRFYLRNRAPGIPPA
jgi:peptidoglycan/LPS O-acetylase OafA/YrhL